MYIYAKGKQEIMLKRYLYKIPLYIINEKYTDILLSYQDFAVWIGVLALGNLVSKAFRVCGGFVIRFNKMIMAYITCNSFKMSLS